MEEFPVRPYERPYERPRKDNDDDDEKKKSGLAGLSFGSKINIKNNNSY